MPGKDVSISFTGLRPGEKLTEDQVSAHEATVPSPSREDQDHVKQPRGRPGLSRPGLSRLFTTLDGGDPEGLRATLLGAGARMRSRRYG